MNKTLIEKLFPGQSYREQFDAELSQQLREVTPRSASDSAVPDIDIEQFQQELSRFDFEGQHDLSDVAKWAVESLSGGLVHMSHPGYFGLYNPSPTYAAECADRIVAAFNPQICVWSHAPVAVDIETHVIRKVALRAGLGECSGGHFTSGGSEANNTAVICALTNAHEDFGNLGVTAFSGQPCIYASAESHLAWLKIAHQSGIGRSAVRLVPTDGQGRMCSEALEKVILQDRANGAVPVFVAATAGTTNAGVVDPLKQTADLCRKYKLWFHVDAAWGGALICSERYRVELDGIEMADSITIDAHKWFATTMGAGMYLCRDKSLLNNTFRVTTDYMPSNNTDIDFYVNSMQWSRRFIGLRLFMSLATAGWKGYAQHVEHSIELIDYLNEAMTAAGWRVANRSRMAVSCLIPPGGENRVEACVNKIVESGDAWVSVTKFESQSVVRVCVTNGRTQVSDIQRLIKLLLLHGGHGD